MTMTVDKTASDGQVPEPGQPGERWTVVPPDQVEEYRKRAAVRAAEDLNDLHEAVILARQAAHRGEDFPWTGDACLLLNGVLCDEMDELCKPFDNVKQAQEDNGDLTDEMMDAITHVVTSAVWFGLVAADVRVTRGVSIPHWLKYGNGEPGNPGPLRTDEDGKVIIDLTGPEIPGWEER